MAGVSNLTAAQLATAYSSGELSPLAMAGQFVVPVLSGNIVGGTALFALLAYGQVVKEM